MLNLKFIYKRNQTQGIYMIKHKIIPLLLAALMPTTSAFASSASGPVKVGLITALSGQYASAGEAITRGLTIAINEINAKGGVLNGRKIELIRRDDQSNPSIGQAEARELIDQYHVAAIFGGIDSPVSLAIVPIANQNKTIFMGTWGADTKITNNGAHPNYIFRVSGVDNLVDKFLVNYAIKHDHTKKGGMMLLDNAWGESNKEGLTVAMAQDHIGNAGAEIFEDQDQSMVPQLSRLRSKGADTIFMVSSAISGAQILKSMQEMGWNVPIVSHWGITGGRFPELAGPAADKVAFVQTYSFMGHQSEIGQKVIKAYEATYHVNSPAKIDSPVGVADSYDAMQITALAINKAGSTNGDAMRKAFYEIGPYKGLIKTYVHPFSHQNHDALTANDYVMCHYVGNDILPIGK